MKCPNCAREIPINQQFCAYCGKKVTVSFDTISRSVSVDLSAKRGRRFGEAMKFVIAVLVAALVCAYVYNDYRHADVVADPAVVMPAPEPPWSAGMTEPPRLDPLAGLEPPKLALPSSVSATPRRNSFRFSPMKDALRTCRGGDDETKKAVEKGLSWLAAAQTRMGTGDGGWSVSKTGGSTRGGDFGVTGLATLAFLADGNIWVIGPDGKVPRYGQVVMSAVHCLVYNQAPDGLISPKEFEKFNYSHAMATAAIAEAYGMSGDTSLREPVDRAVKFIVAAQRPSGGWDYTNKPGARADTSVTGWQVMALVSARRAGVSVPDETFERAIKWFDSVTNPRNALTGYEEMASSRSEEEVTRDYEPLTAISLLCRQMSGLPQDRRLLLRQANILKDKPPVWSPTWQPATMQKRVDLYYWYHATEAMFLVGGVHWDRWNACLKEALVKTQDPQGFWETNTRWGQFGGRVYTTSLAVLCLTTYYRYP